MMAAVVDAAVVVGVAVMEEATMRMIVGVVLDGLDGGRGFTGVKDGGGEWGGLGLGSLDG